LFAREARSAVEGEQVHSERKHLVLEAVMMELVGLEEEEEEMKR
jgi:hypothetical protein